jgi:hypothetical protein
MFERVRFHEAREFLERHRLGFASLGGILCLAFQRMLSSQPVADISHATPEIDVLGDEIAIHTTALDDVIGDVIHDREIGLRPHHQRNVGQVEGTMLVRRQHGDPHIRRRQPPVRHPRPENRVHLGHVGTPQHESIGGLQVVIAAHGLVHAEGAHEGVCRGGHAMARIGVEVVAAKAGLEELVGGIAFPDRPLPGTQHANRLWPALAQSRLELLSHHLERLVPADGFELAVLVELAVAHAQ